MNAWPIRTPLLLRVGHAREGPSRNALGRVDHPELGVGAGAERLGDRGALAAAEQAGVDEDADDPRAQCPGQQRRADRRIDAAGQSADDPVGRADPAGDLGHGALEERAHRPGPRVAADPVEEVAQDQGAIGRVGDLGVELEAVDRPLAVPDRGDRAGRRSRPAARKSPPGVLDLVAVAHPDDRLARDVVEQRLARVEDAALGPAELAAGGLAWTWLPIASQTSCMP